MALRPGNIIRIESIPDGEEHAALDYVEVHLSPERTSTHETLMRNRTKI